MRSLTATIAILAGALIAAPAAVQTPLDVDAIQEALALGRTGIDAARARAHEPYRIMVAVAPIDFVDVITPFRRVALAARASADAGDRTFGQRRAIELLRDTADALDVHVELTFHPLNTYVGVPSFDVLMAPARGRPVDALGVERLPRWTPRVDRSPLSLPAPGAVAGPPPGGPLLGATLVARFDLRMLDPKGVYDLVVRNGNGEVGRTRLELGRLR